MLVQSAVFAAIWYIPEGPGHRQNASGKNCIVSINTVLPARILATFRSFWGEPNGTGNGPFCVGEEQENQKRAMYKYVDATLNSAILIFR